MNRILTATDRTGVKKDADTPLLAKIGSSMRRHRKAILVLQ